MFSAVLFALVKPAEQKQRGVKAEEHLNLQVDTVDLKLAKTEDKLQQSQTVVQKKSSGQMLLCVKHL